ncbi:family 20 glycosylhydrolase [uncultured Bacteroides sp.]|uniref:family 20 glycosylhydrolase n=1 Tax=uncultured Bacteroides sp. TaxID=162156 RepID=UPI0026136F2F|nr:family 20 glycosylhydrolase [uncultured Bacteroides sp.]
MRKYYKGLVIGLGIIGSGFLSACNGISVEHDNISIIPLPYNMVVEKDEFVITEKSTIGVSDKSLIPAAEYLVDILNKSTGYKLVIREGKGDINLSLSISKESDGYRLVSTSDEVTISGNSYAGVIYGIATLRQLLPYQIESKKVVEDIDWTIPTVNIDDTPRFQWRGLMLDVSRHFYDIDEVKELLDLMALYKMNKFHWHLTDDQDWRIEIKKYPMLTKKGAWRKYNSHDKTCMSLARQNDNTDYLIPEEKTIIMDGDTLYGGFYTQNDIKDIVSYAQVRGIDVIPEIDMPGHMLAAVSNYDGVSCFKTTGWGQTFSSPVCPGKDSALEFCKNVYSEIIPLFPYKYIHIGGDEVEKTNWKKCPDCQKRIRENNLKSEEELQSWFIHEMEAFFNSKGKEMIGWDEILEGGLSKTATVMWWRSWVKDAPEKTTSQGNNIIFTPNSHFYLDYQQDKKTLSNIYNYDPAAEFTDKPELVNQVLGVQGNIWCEWIPSRERMQYMVVPRMQAIAEVGWSNPEHKDWNGFIDRLTDHFERLDEMNVNYRIPDLEGFYDSNVFVGEANVDVTCIDPNAQIHYTTDGSIPTLESPKYDGNLKITDNTDLVFRTFRPDGKPCDVFKTRFIKGEFSPAASITPSNKGLKAVWYNFAGDKCSDIDKAERNGEYSIADVSIPEGVNGRIGLVINGFINIPADGIYTFALTSDDGSTLVIDGDKVVDNDGPHSPREVVGQKAMSKGYHPIELRYFDSNGGVLKMEVRDGEGNVLPVSDLYAY